MDKYISADRLIRRLENRPYKAVPNFIKMVEEQEAADVVSRGVLEQVMWERDLAISQLAEIGKGLGEKMDDVQEVRHGRWIWDDEGYHCSECFFHAYGETGEILSGHWHYCPNCGAKMEGVAENG